MGRHNGPVHRLQRHHVRPVATRRAGSRVDAGQCQVAKAGRGIVPRRWQRGVGADQSRAHDFGGRLQPRLHTRCGVRHGLGQLRVPQRRQRLVDFVSHRGPCVGERRRGVTQRRREATQRPPKLRQAKVRDGGDTCTSGGRARVERRRVLGASQVCGAVQHAGCGGRQRVDSGLHGGDAIRTRGIAAALGVEVGHLRTQGTGGGVEVRGHRVGQVRQRRGLDAWQQRAHVAGQRGAHRRGVEERGRRPHGRDGVHHRLHADQLLTHRHHQRRVVGDVLGLEVRHHVHEAAGVGHEVQDAGGVLLERVTGDGQLREAVCHA